MLALAALSLGRAFAAEIVEPWDDGTTPRRRYEVDEAGRRIGRYVEYHRDGKAVATSANYRDGALDGPYLESYENGRPRLRAAYRAGRREGRLEALEPDGAPLEVAAYVGGRLDGKRQVWRAKRLVATQSWKAGALVTLDGAIAFPRVRDDVERTVARILSGELPAIPPASRTRPAAGGQGGGAGSPSGPPSPALAAAPAGLAALRDEALRRLRAYRYVCEVPWEDLVAGEAESLSAQYASLVCAKLGTIAHEPSNPGLPEALFRICARAASECNQTSGVGMTGRAAVDAFMDDSDAANVGRLGHRRSLLALELQTTGFGFSDGEAQRFVAMSKYGAGRARSPDLPFVVFPGRGWTPTDMCSSHHAWSVGIEPVTALQLDVAGATIRVRRLSDDFVPADEELPIERFPFDKDSRKGGRPALIFRPVGVEVVEGAAYLAELSAVDPKTHRPTVFLRWVAGFCAARAGSPASAMPDVRR